jgi:two-component system NtrC family response regulator
MNSLLLIVADADIQLRLTYALSKDYTVFQASDKNTALQIFKKNHPPVVILDLVLSTQEDDFIEGLLCLREILQNTPETKIITVIDADNKDAALKAIQNGAYMYCYKPIDNRELMIFVEKALDIYQIESQHREMQKTMNNGKGFAGIIGQSPEMINVFQLIEKISITDSPILITGESGTGKGLIAQTIHSESHRTKDLYFPVNCADTSENIIENAILAKEIITKKTFNKYDTLCGTIFFDKIDELSLIQQKKLFLALQEKTIKINNGKHYISIDVRMIAANKNDLFEMVKEGTFREDLFFKLNVIEIKVPPLRDRESDLMLLAYEFLDECKKTYRKRIKDFTRDAKDAISNYDWPGNVNELKNKIQRAVLTSDNQFIEANDLGLENPDKKIPQNIYSILTLKEARNKFEKDLIASVVKRHNGNIKRASEELGVSRPTLYDLIAKHKLTLKNDFQ